METVKEEKKGRSFIALLLERPATLAAFGVVLFVIVFQLSITPANPPGFHRDEASVAYNAYTLSQDLRDRYAQTHALSYAVTHGMSHSNVSILPDGGIPPAGSIVFGRYQACDYICTELDRSHSYWIAKAAGTTRRRSRARHLGCGP